MFCFVLFSKVIRLFVLVLFVMHEPKNLLVYFILVMMLSGLFCLLLLPNKSKTKQIIFIFIYYQMSTRLAEHSQFIKMGEFQEDMP